MNALFLKELAETTRRGLGVLQRTRIGWHRCADSCTRSRCRRGWRCYVEELCQRFYANKAGITRRLIDLETRQRVFARIGSALFLA
jgi:hypothetical protein